MLRVRLKFDSTPLNYAKKCWFTFDREKCRLVSDVSHLIASRFSLGKTHGIQVNKSPPLLVFIFFSYQLYMKECLVPTNENAAVFRDEDEIQ